MLCHAVTHRLSVESHVASIAQVTQDVPQKLVPVGHRQMPPEQNCPAAHATVAYPCPSALHTCRPVVLPHTGPALPGVHVHAVQTPTPRQAFIVGQAAAL